MSDRSVTADPYLYSGEELERVLEEIRRSWGAELARMDRDLTAAYGMDVDAARMRLLETFRE